MEGPWEDIFQGTWKMSQKTWAVGTRQRRWILQGYSREEVGSWTWPSSSAPWPYPKVRKGWKFAGEGIWEVKKTMMPLWTMLPLTCDLLKCWKKYQLCRYQNNTKKWNHRNQNQSTGYPCISLLPSLGLIFFLINTDTEIQPKLDKL